MRRTITRGLLSIALASASMGVGCGGQKEGGGTTAGPGETATTTGTATATGAGTGATTTTGTATTTATATAAGSSDAPAASGSAAAGAKTFDCGAKGQKPCPMQGWMKTVMAGASSSGDGGKLAEALNYVAAHSPPGYAGWSALASAGAVKAKAGDIDGAKQSCKACHDQFKEKYKTTLRDRPF